MEVTADGSPKSTCPKEVVWASATRARDWPSTRVTWTATSGATAPSCTSAAATWSMSASASVKIRSSSAASGNPSARQSRRDSSGATPVRSLTSDRV